VILYDIHDHPPLSAPLMIVAFDAWVEAGSAATTAADLIAEGAEPIAEIDSDVLYDYRARRPRLHIDDGRLVSAEWPDLAVLHRPFAERDVLVLTGPEPDYRWRELSRELADLASELGVEEWITLGSIPAAVPHTRAVNILGTASADGLLKGGIDPGPVGSMEVPAAAVSIIDIAIAEAGIPAVGYFAQVPHYVNGDYPAAAVALVRAVEPHLGERISTASLELEAQGMEAKLDTAAASDDSTTSYVERLEEMSDQAKLPTGEELIGDIENFLRDRDPGDGDLPR
jgi:proteasome assembly chaperone (PAC2) family protein